MQIRYIDSVSLPPPVSRTSRSLTCIEAHARSAYRIPFIQRRIPRGNILIKSQLAKSELIVLHQIIIIIGLTSVA